ncbi:hypothetical protein [Streptomyces nitrosporeus]|uniref:hypothetical protein n=1 Tax=Streptomyces nitrosporeus TaxID=28894 RepID=UPI0039A1A01A
MKPLNDTTRNRLIQLLEAGSTNRDIARTLGLNKATPARYRRLLGIAPAAIPPPRNRSELTLAEKWRTLVREDVNGHMTWTGRTAHGTITPVMTHRSKTYTARSVAYEIRSGRTPVGYVKPNCGRADCIAPDHLDDEQDRIRDRAELGRMLGRQSHITECTRGHAVAEHRRYLPDGSGYCGTCHDLNKRARRAAA